MSNDKIDLYISSLEDSTKKYKEAMLLLPEAESGFRDMDGITKTVLAEAYIQCPAGTAKDREMTALSSDVYKEHLSNLCFARIEYLTAISNVRIQEKRLDTARSILSVEKAKLGIL